MKFSRLNLVIVLSLIILSLTLSAYASITPEQVLIIANRRSTASRQLANFYANARNIPERNILLLDCPTRELISREVYNKSIAYPIRIFIRQQNLQNKIKVLVTIYGIPLKVADSRPTRKQRQLANVIKQKYFYTFKSLEDNYRQLENLAGMTTTQPTTLPARNKINTFLRKLPSTYHKIQSLYRRIVSHIKRTSDPIEKQMLIDKFVYLRFIFEGRVFVLQNPENRNPKIFNQLHQLESQYWQLAGKNPLKRNNEQFYEIAREYGGLMLLLKTLYEDYQRLMQRDSEAAVDSELSLVLWNDYPLAGRVPNALNPRFADHPFVINRPPVMMVSRLDAPSAEIVKRMIRDSIAVEKKSLNGTVYIDARGLKKKRGFIVYDDDLRRLAQLLRSKTSFKVVLDNRPSLFKPGACPDTALYCGWYSLRRYIPAFTFVPGAVGYHIASFEAQTLHQKKNNNRWCPKMLQAGVAATLGPVDEPFLDAFPLPSEFFELLLTGKYTIAEVFYKTIRYNSWRMILIADPLYNPFVNSPRLDEKDVKLHKLSLLLIR